jgi:hypothetical protein
MNEEEVERRVEERIAEVIAKQGAVLKKRYREQALKAVEAAEKNGTELVDSLRGEIITLQEKISKSSSSREAHVPVSSEVKREQLEAAYEKGRLKGSESARVAEDEVRRYKAVLKMMQANDQIPKVSESGTDSNNGSILMVKYIMENVYREVKKEFANKDTDAEAIQRMKSVLNSANTSLTSKLGELALVRKDHIINLEAQIEQLKQHNQEQKREQAMQEAALIHLKQQQQQQQQQENQNQHGSLSQPKKGKNMQRSGNDMGVYRTKRSSLYLQSYSPPIQSYIQVHIDRSILSKVKSSGVFGALRGGSEEVVLYSLVSSFMNRTENHNMDSTFDAESAKSYSQERRYKEFCSLFKQLRKDYPMLMLPPVPDSDTLAQNKLPLADKHFCTHLEDLTTRDSESTNNGTSSNGSQRGQQGNDGDDDIANNLQVKARRRLLNLWLQHLCHHATIQQSSALNAFLQGQGSDKHELPHAKILSSQTTLERSVGILSPATNSSQMYIPWLSSRPEYAIELALKDLVTIKKDVRRLDTSMGEVTDAGKELADNFANKAKSQWNMAEIVQNLVATEKNEGGTINLCYDNDTIAWDIVGTALSSTCSIAPPIYEFLHYACFERSVNATAIQQIETNKAFVKDSSASSSPIGAIANTGFGSLGSPMSFVSDDGETDEVFAKKLSVAVGTSEEWDSCCRVRQVQTVHVLKQTAARARAAHSEALAWWEQARQDLLQLSSSPTSKVDNRKAAREVLVGDCRALASQLQTLKNDYRTKKRMQGDFSSLRKGLTGEGSAEAEADRERTRTESNALDPLAGLDATWDTDATTLGHVPTPNANAPIKQTPRNVPNTAPKPQVLPRITPAATDSGREQDTYVRNMMSRPVLPAQQRRLPGPKKHRERVSNDSHHITSTAKDPAFFEEKYSDASDMASSWHESEWQRQNSTESHGDNRNRGYSDLWGDEGITQTSASAPVQSPTRSTGPAPPPPPEERPVCKDPGSPRFNPLAAMAPIGNVFSAAATGIGGIFSGGSSQETTAPPPPPLERTFSDAWDSDSGEEEVHTPKTTQSTTAASDVWSDDEEDTPMNRAIRKQKQQAELQKEKEALAAQKTKGLLGAEVHEPRRVGGRGRHKTGASSTKKATTGQANVVLGGEWGATPKPASALKSTNGPGHGANKVGYFGTVDKAATEDLPAMPESIPKSNTASAPIAVPQARSRTLPQQTRAASDAWKRQASGTSRVDHVHPSQTNLREEQKVPQQQPQQERQPQAQSQAQKQQTTKPQVVQDPNLPDGWEAVCGDDGRTYYYHRVTRVSRWDKPDAALAASHAQRLAAQDEEVNIRTAKRKAELADAAAVAEVESQVRQDLQAGIRQTIQKWAKHPSIMNKTKSLAGLLTSVHTIVSLVPADAVVKSTPLTDSSEPSEVKKAFMRAVRYLHPDKLSRTDVDLHTRTLAEAVFIFLTEEFDKYKLQLGI